MSAARTERLLNLLTLLLNTRRPIALREIREMDEFHAYRTSDPKSGERAFERDKAALIELGVPLRWVPPEQADDDEDGIGGYVIERDRYFLPDLHLEPAELALLSIAGSAAAGIRGFPGRSAVVRALAKLGFDIDDESPMVSIAHAPMLEGVDAESVGAHLEVLHDAVARKLRVALSYRRGDELSEREVDPYGLYYRRGAWYLVGYCHLREAERTFHLGRVASVALAKGQSKASAHFELPEDFDLHTHVARRPWEFPSHAPLVASIQLHARLVPAIPEIFGQRVSVEESSAGATVRVEVKHRQALIAAVLPYGAAAEVLEPADLRNELRDIYRDLAARHREEAGS